MPLNHFRTDKVRALLAYLAVEGERTHSRTELATLFWGELGDTAARANLRKSLFLLRQIFEDAAEELLKITRNDVQFNTEAATVDVHQFIQLTQANAVSLQHLDPLSQLKQAAESDQNLMPLFVTCVENDVTLGEICHTLRGVWGEYRPTL